MSLQRATVLTSLLFLLTTFSESAAERMAKPTRVDGPSASHLAVLHAGSSTSDSLARLIMPTDDITWRVDGWVEGQELFKNFIDPSKHHSEPYPFTVTEINMPLYFAGPTRIVVSVDIEDAMYVTPDYPIPGSPLSISSDYELNIPREGYFDIWVQLDEPIEVSGPFFAGFFIGNIASPSAGVAVMTDGNTSAVGRCFNIWDEETGFVDLLKNRFGNFPGRLVLGAAGIAAGDKPIAPNPEISILSPSDDDKLFSRATFWVHETSGSPLIDYISFEYSSGDGFVELGRDYDGSAAVRDGVGPSGEGDGFCYLWDFSTLTEGAYILRATAYDFKGRFASDEVTVYLEPTPPTPDLLSFENGMQICGSSDILISCCDENLARVDLFAKLASADYSAGLKSVAHSEFDGPYTAAIAAASAFQLWVDRGYLPSSHKTDNRKSIISLGERLAHEFGLRDNRGITDESLYTGLQQFCRESNTPLKVEYECRPDYYALRRLIQEEEQSAIIALGGTPGTWLAVDGFSGWINDNGTCGMNICNPQNGSIEFVAVRQDGPVCKLKLRDNWQPIDRVIAIGADGWDTDRAQIGADTEPSDGWQLHWPTDNLSESDLCFLRAVGTDAGGIRHASSVILEYSCEEFYETGDYNNDGRADIVDLTYLIDFVVNSGKSPAGGKARADANGDSRVNIADIVYYSNYLFRFAGSPKW